MRGKIITIIGLSLWGCSKDTCIPEDKVVEGKVFEDCQGNPSVGKKVYLTYYQMGCAGGGVLSTDSVMTDNNGHFSIHYTAPHEHEQSTTNYYHVLSVQHSTINLADPVGHYDLYPNEVKMNAVIRLKFMNSHASRDTFHYQFLPTDKGSIQKAGFTGYLIPPFHDTTLVLQGLTVGNANSRDNGERYSGIFRWAFGRAYLNTYYTGRDGYLDLTHQPCAAADTFEYKVIPIK